MEVLTSALKEAIVFGTIYVLYVELADDKDSRNLCLKNFLKYLTLYVFASYLLRASNISSGETIANTTAAIMGTWLLGLINPS